MSINASGVLSPSMACSRSASHAPPVYRPTIALFARMRGRSSAVSCSQSASASGSFIEVLLQEKLRRHRVDLAFFCPPYPGASQPGLRFGRGMALVYARHRQLEAALKPAREVLGLPRHRMRLALRGRRQAHDQRSGLPLADEQLDLIEARHCRQRMRRAQLGLSDGDADAL